MYGADCGVKVKTKAPHPTLLCVVIYENKPQLVGDLKRNMPRCTAATHFLQLPSEGERRNTPNGLTQNTFKPVFFFFFEWRIHSAACQSE